MPVYAIGYDDRLWSLPDSARDVLCETCDTIDHATPRRQRCRFCGGPVAPYDGGVSPSELRVMVVCGVGDCAKQLLRTYRPASALWCPVHGHVLDAPPSPPLSGVGYVCLDFGGDG